MLIDLHNDLGMRLVAEGFSLTAPASTRPENLQIDFEKIRASHPDVLFCAAYSDPHFRGLEALDVVHAQMQALKTEFGNPYSPARIALSQQDIRKIRMEGKTAAVLTVEGGYALKDDLDPLDELYSAGMRLLTLTHSKATDWAGSEADQPEIGLTSFGKKVVHRLNEMGVIVDLAHTSTETILATARESKAPVLFSHGGIRHLAGSTRSIEDEAIRAIAETGGVIGISFYPPHLQPTVIDEAWHQAGVAKIKAIVENQTLAPLERFKQLTRLFTGHEGIQKRPSGIELIFANIDYVVQLVGDDFVGFGGDYDGIPYTCTGIEDLSKIRQLIQYMRKQGYSENRINKISGLNAQRVIDTVLK